MITYAEACDKEAVYQLWKELFVDDDGGYTDYYFQHRYEEAITYVCKEAGEVVATLQRRKHQVMFHHQVIQVSMILGVATKPSHQGKGYMHALMKQALLDAQGEELVTMIQAYHPEMYVPFGFMPAYYTTCIDYEPQLVNVTGELGKVDYSKCVALYNQMMQDYDGYMIRDEVYYKAYQMELKAQGYELIGYYVAGEMLAYAVLETGDNKLVSECIGTLEARSSLLALLYQRVGSFSVREMSNQKKDTIDTMLLFHDWETFQQFTHISSASPQAYLDDENIPRYFHECA